MPAHDATLGATVGGHEPLSRRALAARAERGCAVRVKGVPGRIGDLARAFAACHPVRVNGVSPSPVLLRGYLETAEQCVRANDCALCRRELERLATAMGTTCTACGRERFRRFCQGVGPCPVGGTP